MDDVTFSFSNFVGVRNNETCPNDEMPRKYNASGDQHAREEDSEQNPTTLDKNTLRHNIMRSYLEVSEWLGDGALQYGSHNGFVSRKMSLAWLFNAIKALINWKLANQDKWAEVDIHPLVVDDYELVNKPATGWDTSKTYYSFNSSTRTYSPVPQAQLSQYQQLYILASDIHERFLKSGEQSTQGKQYDDEASLN